MTRGAHRARGAQSYIYFVRSEPTGCIKIGISCGPNKRLSELQVGNPVRLELLGVRPGGEPDESRLHAELADDRATGEWFHPTASVLLAVQRELAGCDPDAWFHIAMAVEA